MIQPNAFLLHKLKKEKNPYCPDSGYKFDSIVEIFWLHFYRIEINRRMPFIFIVTRQVQSPVLGGLNEACSR